MNNILLNIRYKMSYQFTWLTWSLAIIVITLLLTFYPLIKFSLITQAEGSLVYRLWVLVIVQFAITMKFKEDFDFLLTLSNTRKNVFLSQLGISFVFSVFLSGLIVLERLIIDHLNNIFGFHNIVDPFHFFSPNGTDNLFMQFAFFLMLCTCCSVFGLLMGSLFYRFGKKFILAFWLIFSAIPTVVFPIILWMLHLRGNLSQSITDMIEFIRYFDLPAGSMTLFSLTIIFGITAWLNIRKLPLK